MTVCCRAGKRLGHFSAVLFNSFEFIFVFLPATTALFFLLVRRCGSEYGLGLLVAASLLFYAWWQPAYIFLLLFSITVNFALGGLLIPRSTKHGRKFLVSGVIINLGFLGYYKYANFFVDNVSTLLGTGWRLDSIVLPLAISFFTFQQISYLVDSYQGKTREYNFLHYCLFVCFFPQLIAGPIVHHKEMLPQFMQQQVLTPRWSNFAIGLSIFAIGLFKKTVIADSLSTYVGPVYDVPTATHDLDFFRAWGSTLAYTFQLYFDFSGYSDMAIGCARIFGIKLPVNFFSPYKASSIIEFWRRWHITLSRFLRDYLYIALGGNRKGKARRFLNLFLTMLLGGLWHGAGWPFVVWGALHGAYLIVNHAWHWLSRRLDFDGRLDSIVFRALSWLLTFAAVVVAWVYFRAPTVEHANGILFAMLGGNGAVMPNGIAARLGNGTELLASLGITTGHGGGRLLLENMLWIILAGLIALLLPNTAQVFDPFEPVLYEHKAAFEKQRRQAFIKWTPTLAWSSLTATFALLGILTLTRVSEFLYFQF